MPSDTSIIQSALNASLGQVVGATTVTVKQLDPDTGAVSATSTGVDAVWRDKRRVEASVEDGGVAVELIRWRLLASAVDFVPRKRDTVTDAGGVVWTLTEDMTTTCQGTRYVGPAKRLLTS